MIRFSLSAPNKKNVSLFIFLVVSFLFSAKYLYRVTPFAGIISLAITLLYLVLWNKKKHIFPNKEIAKKIVIAALIIFVGGSFYVFKKIPVETLNVDRWSVITSFWDSFFNGEYVYFAKSTMSNYPGPMPFYFIMALPFYFLSELGYFSILGVLVFYFLIEKTIRSRTLKSITIILILMNIPYLWEVACRSNIFLNGTLVLGVLILFVKQKEFNYKNSLAIGILIGLVLSTRNVFVIPFIIVFVYCLKIKKITIRQTVIIGAITVLTFCLTFLPFVWNYFAEFKTMNPFIIQSDVLIPFHYTLLFILASFVAGFYCKNDNEIYFYSSLILFNSILIYFLYWIMLRGFEETFTKSAADISYFILCLPFALYHLLKETEN
jgi:hypothetical protein